MSTSETRRGRQRYLTAGALCLVGWLGMRGLTALSTQDLTRGAKADPATTADGPQPSAQVLAEAAAGRSPAVAKLRGNDGGAQAGAGAEPHGYRHVRLVDMAKFEVPRHLSNTDPAKLASAVLAVMPRNLRELEGQALAVRGFMLPIDLDDEGRVQSFGLMPNQNSCCYGVAPPANGWVMVKLVKGKTVQATMDTPVEVHGRLHMVAEAVEGELTGLYQMTAYQVVKPAD